MPEVTVLPHMGDTYEHTLDTHVLAFVKVGDHTGLTCCVE